MISGVMDRIRGERKPPPSDGGVRDDWYQSERLGQRGRESGGETDTPPPDTPPPPERRE